MRRSGVRSPSAPPFVFNRLRLPAVVAVMANWPILGHFSGAGRERFNRNSLSLLNHPHITHRHPTSEWHNNWAIVKGRPVTQPEPESLHKNSFALLPTSSSPISCNNLS